MRKAFGLVALACVFAVGCAHTPTSGRARAKLRDAAWTTLRNMEAKDPGLRLLLDDAAGYIVFPSVGEGGFFVGGGAGVGVVFEGGQATGYAELTHFGVGALAGGQRFSQLVVVRDPAVFEQMKNGRFDFGAKASAIMIGRGAASMEAFDNGVAVFLEPLRGFMMNASLSGQRIRFSM